MQVVVYYRNGSSAQMDLTQSAIDWYKKNGIRVENAPAIKLYPVTQQGADQASHDMINGILVLPDWFKELNVNWYSQGKITWQDYIQGINNLLIQGGAWYKIITSNVPEPPVPSPHPSPIPSPIPQPVPQPVPLPLGAPSAPVLEIDMFSYINRIFLKWKKQPGITTYDEEESSPTTNPLWKSIGDFQAGDFDSIYKGVEVGRGTKLGVYKFRIRAKNSYGYSQYSNVVQYTINSSEGSPPPPPGRSELGLFGKVLSALFVGAVVLKK